MFLCKVKLRPSLHHIVCAVLLLGESSFTASVNESVNAIASVPLISTPSTCLSCDKGNVSSNTTTEASFKTTSSEAPTSPSAINLTLTLTKTPNEVGNTSTVSTNHPSLQPKTPGQPPAPAPSNSSLSTARTQTIAATANLRHNVTHTTSLVTPASRVTTAKTVNETKTTTASVTNSTTTTAKTTATHTTGSLATTKTSTSSPPLPSSSSNATLQPSTRLQLAPTTIVTTLPSTRTASSATTPETTTTRSKSAPSETTAAAMVEVLGDALSRQLASTALLLGVLVCGSLLFVITVMLFVKQAYESYNRKDYSQVDYLINGMYSDSSV